MGIFMNEREILDRIQGAFSTELPTEMILLDSINYSNELTRMTMVTWDEISFEVLSADYDMVHFLSPEAFRYYMPAFLSESIKHFDIIELFLNSMISIFTLHEPLERKYSCLNNFSTDQWSVIEEWFDWIRENEDITDLVEFDEAYETVKLKIWQCYEGRCVEQSKGSKLCRLT
jgi:hypothetical protein